MDKVHLRNLRTAIDILQRDVERDVDGAEGLKLQVQYMLDNADDWDTFRVHYEAFANLVEEGVTSRRLSLFSMVEFDLADRCARLDIEPLTINDYRDGKDEGYNVIGRDLHDNWVVETYVKAYEFDSKYNLVKKPWVLWVEVDASDLAIARASIKV